MPTKVLLINGASQDNIILAPPVGLYKLQHYLAQRNVTCDVLVPDLDREECFLERTCAGEYAVIGISCSHWSMRADLERLWRFRQASTDTKRQVVFAAGGQEASQNYEQWLNNGIDIVFLGFAERNFYTFCASYLSGRASGAFPQSVAAVDGVVFRDETGTTIFKPTEPLTAEYFEEITYTQAMTITVPYERYWDALRARMADTNAGSSFVFEYVRLYTTSHCPRRCGFCNSQSFLPCSQQSLTPIHFLSADQVLDLVLENVRKHHARGFAFSDDDFPVGSVSGINRLRDFSRKMVALKQSGKLDKSLFFAIQARIADFVQTSPDGTRAVDLELLELMHRAGFRSIALGVESFSDRILRAPSVNKLGVSLADCHDVLRAMMRSGLVPLINLIIGIPEYTPDELADTLDVAMSYIAEGCEINITGPLYALPGAPLCSDSRYAVRSYEWINTHNGRTEYISSHFVPEHALIGEISDNYEPALSAELERVRQRYYFGDRILHKRVKNVIGILVVARLLGRDEMVVRYEDVLNTMIHGGMRIAC